MKFIETIEKYREQEINIYFDMDGVLAEYDIDNFNYEEIRPIQSIINKVELLDKTTNINVRILSICKKSNIIEEKIKWLREHMSFISIEKLSS